VWVCVCVKPRFQALEGGCLCENLKLYTYVPKSKVSSLTSTLLPQTYDGAACHACSLHSHSVGTFPDQDTSVLGARTTRYLATKGAVLAVPRHPLGSRLHVSRGCLLLHSVPTCLTSPPYPSTQTRSKPLISKTRHGISASIGTRDMSGSPLSFVLLRPSAYCIVYASSENASRDIAAWAVPVLTGSSADDVLLASAEVRLSGRHCADLGAVLGAAARERRLASCSAMSCRIRTQCMWRGGGFRKAGACVCRVLYPRSGQKPHADGYARLGGSFRE